MSLEPRRVDDVAIGSLTLTNGRTLDGVIQRICWYGVSPRADGANVVYVTHAMTGSARVADWWGGIVGPGLLLDTDRLAILSANILGSCYGSTGPMSLAADGEPYALRFPVVTVADMVLAQRTLLGRLGLGSLAAIIGASLGAMQALQWVLDEPQRFARAICVAAYETQPALTLAMHAVAHDAVAQGLNDAGLRLARMINTVTYKSDHLFEERFAHRPDRAGGDPRQHILDRFDVGGYLAYQGQRFLERMDPYTYLVLQRAMDLFDLRERRLVAGPTALTFVGIDSDWLSPADRIRRSVTRFAQAGYSAEYRELHSTHGHDAFLVDVRALTELLQPVFAPLYDALNAET